MSHISFRLLGPAVNNAKISQNSAWLQQFYAYLRAKMSKWNKWNEVYLIEFKARWSFRMTSDVTCLETYKNIKTMHILHWN